MKRLSDAEREELRKKIAESHLQRAEEIERNFSQDTGKKGGFFWTRKSGNQ